MRLAPLRVRALLPQCLVSNMDEKTALTHAITKGLAYQENGGSLDINKLKAGKSGELKSIFQFTPDTWKAEAKKYLGDENAPITPDNETHVVTEQVGQWIDEGKNVKQIASMWNAGHGEPDAYTGKFSNGQPSVGKNKEGVKFNVPAYADSVQKYATKFYTEAQNTKSPSQVAQTPSSPQQPTQGQGLMQQAAWHVPWTPSASSAAPVPQT